MNASVIVNRLLEDDVDPDDPTAFIKREVARRGDMKKLEIQGRVWWRRPSSGGGGYNKVYIYVNDKLVHVTPENGGGEGMVQTNAQRWLWDNGYLAGLLGEREPLWYLRDKKELGVEYVYNVTEVRRERDL